MRQDLDWDTYRYFMTVVDKGSLSAASRFLRVSQPTVGRKLRNIESKFGVQLFQREIHGYSLTEAGEAIVELCREMADKAADIERAIDGYDRSKTGQVRIATAVGLGTYWLAPRLPMLRTAHPSIEVQLMVSTSMVDLMRKEADVALRIGNPGSDELVGRKVGIVGFGIYGADSYLDQHGEPGTLEELCEHTIIESSGSLAELPQARRFREVAKGAKIGLQCDNLPMQVAAACAGGGLIALPHYVAKAMPGLRRVVAAFDLALDLWLLTHRDLKSIARVRTVLDFVTKETRRGQLGQDAHPPFRICAA